MKRILQSLVLISLFLGLSSTNCSAQQIFGFFSYSTVQEQLPEYQTIKQTLADLKAKFDAETSRVEKDFNEKYEEFLDGQKEFPTVILQKRQTELQEMMEKNMAFKQEARRLYRKAEKESMDALRQKINRIVAQIGQERKYAFIINIDENACPWVDPQQGVNLNKEITDRMKVNKLTELDIAR